MLASSSDKLILFQINGEMILHKIEAIGVHVFTNCCPSEQLTRLADDESGDEISTGLQLQDGTILNANLVIFAIGIKPRDELAKAADIECHPRGAVVVSDICARRLCIWRMCKLDGCWS
jgi:nitrite reductase (NAD(P)H)